MHITTASKGIILKKKLLLISIPVGVVLLAAAGYLYGIPSLQTNGYKAVQKSDQLSLSTSANAAITAAKQSAFLDQDVTIAQAKNAVKIANDAIGDLESKIRSTEKGLTTFSELPLIANINGGYKTTLGVRSLEVQYVKASNDYLAEFKSVNEYNEKSIPILEMSEQVETISASMQNATTPEDVVAVIDQLIAKLNQASKIAGTLKPAESQKESHEAGVKGLKDMTALLQQMKAAVVALDLDQFMTLAQAFEEKGTSLTKESKALTIKLVEKSKLTQLGDKINALNKQIDTKTTNW